MTPEERISAWNIHPSIRGQFSFELYKLMAKDERIFLLTGDLGYGMFDAHKEDFSDRYINCGASEQSMMGIAVGVAQEGKIPFVYSITPFLIYRSFETIRNYLHYEKTPVKLIGSGRDKDYEIDGVSHWAAEVRAVLDCIPNIETYWPNEIGEIEAMVNEIAYNEKPSFLSLRR